MTGPAMLEAIEVPATIHASMDQFERKFSAGGRLIAGLGNGAIWQDRFGIWGHFSESGRRTPPDKYWNVFGQQPMRLRQNMLVEINPPGSGKNLNRQGVLARDDRGHRWLLHQGRLHPRGMRIIEDKFDAVAAASRVKVRYADGTVAACHPVTDIDKPADQVRHDVAAFVDLCARVRVHYQLGAVAREMLERISVAEASSSPERQGAYSLPPLPARTAERRHADIWHALVKELDALDIKHANSRFGRYGPDLFAQTPGAPLLFEIKADATASDIQRALGQLQLYEHLGGQACRKIMVLPEVPDRPIAQALLALGIDLLLFTRQGNAVRLDRAALRKLIGSGSGKARKGGDASSKKRQEREAMPVARIERVVGGSVTGHVERGSDGLFACHDFGSNVTPTRLATLDEVADFLRSRPRSGVCMNPGWCRITTNIYIDGVRLR